MTGKGLDYYAGDWCWCIEYNELAEGGSKDSLLPPWRDVEDVINRSGRIADRYTIVWWDND